MADRGDLKAHESTYNSMIFMLKWGAVIAFLLAAFVIFLLV